MDVVITYRPISTWLGEHARSRRAAPFSASWTSTRDLLDRELRALSAKRVVIELDLPESAFRIDGQPRANAPTPAMPGVVVSISESRHGPLRYACDAFTRWQDNLRAVALGLEALRKVERYGIAQRGEQYAGWKQLPASTMSREQARDVLLNVLLDYGVTPPLEAHIDARVIARRAMRLAHPDNGGDPDVFRDEIMPAYKMLTESQRGLTT